MTKYDIPPQFEYQNTIFGQISNVKIGFQMSNMIIAPISNVKIGF